MREFFVGRLSDLATMILVVALVTGCSSDTNGRDVIPDVAGVDTGISYPADGYLSDSCTSKVAVHDKASLIHEISSEWPVSCNVFSGPIIPSATLVISDPIVLDYLDFSKPTLCSDTEDHYYCHPIEFRIATDAPAEVVSSHEDGRVSSVRLTGNVRVMPWNRYTNSSAYTPVIAIFPGCAESCGEHQTLCTWNSLCMDDPGDAGPGYVYCRECLGGSEVACLCWENGHAKPDGTDCELTDPCNDSFPTSECRSGLCVPVNQL